MSVDLHDNMDLDYLIDQVKRLPPNPLVMLKLMKLLQDLNIGSHQIVSLIRVDSALTAQILRIANSVFYNAVEYTSDLGNAVTRIGFRETYKLAGAICSGQLFAIPPPPTYPGSEQLWDHSILVALVMEDLAPRLGLETTVAYTVGLLHSIGKVLVNQLAHTKYQEIYALIDEQSMPLPAAEKQVLGYNHVEIGVALLKKWKSPAEVYIPIRNQFTPLAETECRRLACALHVALTAVQSATPTLGYLARGSQTFMYAMMELPLDELELDQALHKAQESLETIKLVLSTGLTS